MGEIIKRKVLCQGRYLRLVCYESWEYVERVNATGVVVIAATTDSQELVLTEQFRIPHQSNVIELPAGLVGDSKKYAHEDVIHAAQRELLEETGYKAQYFNQIISGPSSSGITNETYALFHAHGLSKIGPGGGVDNERISVHLVSLKDAFNWLKHKESHGILVDPKILAALFYLKQN